MPPPPKPGPSLLLPFLHAAAIFYLVHVSRLDPMEEAFFLMLVMGGPVVLLVNTLGAGLVFLLDRQRTWKPGLMLLISFIAFLLAAAPMAVTQHLRAAENATEWE